MTETKSPMRRRFDLGLAGVAFAGIGLLRLRNGVQVVTNWYGQLLFSWGLVASGALCSVFALIPISWIAKAAETSKEKHARQLHESLSTRSKRHSRKFKQQHAPDPEKGD